MLFCLHISTKYKNLQQKIRNILIGKLFYTGNIQDLPTACEQGGSDGEDVHHHCLDPGGDVEGYMDRKLNFKPPLKFTWHMAYLLLQSLGLVNTWVRSS